jgi:hypothetical protein
MVKFPLLLIASDGWIGYFKNNEELGDWNYLAINKYNHIKPIIMDADDLVWKINRILPNKPPSFIDKLLAYTFYNPLIPVTFELDPVAENPLTVVKEAVKQAIDADDDILTQWVEADKLQGAVKKASSFKSLVAILKKKKAI